MIVQCFHQLPFDFWGFWHIHPVQHSSLRVSRGSWRDYIGYIVCPTACLSSPWPLVQPCHIGWRLWHLRMVVGGLHHWILPPWNPVKMASKRSSSIGQVQWDYSKLIWKVIFKDPKDHSMDNTSSEYYSVSLRFGWARKLAPQQFAAQTTPT